jgi:hypothetical protein
MEIENISFVAKSFFEYASTRHEDWKVPFVLKEICNKHIWKWHGPAGQTACLRHELFETSLESTNDTLPPALQGIVHSALSYGKMIDDGVHPERGGKMQRCEHMFPFSIGQSGECIL